MGKTETPSSNTSSQLKSNIKYSLLVKFLHVALNLYLVRFCIRIAGEDNYGYWLAILSIFTLFSCVEVGLNNGFRKSLTRSFEENDADQFRALSKEMYRQTIFHYLMVFGLACMAIVLFPMQLFFEIYSISEISLKLTLLACMGFYCIHYVFFSFNTILLSVHKAKSTFIWFFIQSVLQLATLAGYYFLFSDHNLVSLCLSMSIPPAITWILVVFRSRKDDFLGFDFSLQWKGFTSRFVTNLVSRRFLILQLATLLLISTDNLLIMKMVSPSEVSAYQVVLKYFNVLVIAFNTILVPFWSAFAKEDHSNSIEWISRKMKQLFLFWIFIALVSMVMLSLSDFAFDLWIGKDLGITIALSISVVIYTLQTLWNSLFAYYLNSVEQIKGQVVLFSIGAILNIPLSWYMAQNYGAQGIVISTVVSLLPLSLFLPWRTRKLIRESYAK